LPFLPFSGDPSFFSFPADFDLPFFSFSTYSGMFVMIPDLLLLYAKD
jgi:hypothetical protein